MMKHISKYHPFDENNYKEFFVKEFGTQLGAVEFHEASVIYDAFKMIPKKIIKNLVSILDFDPALGQSKKIYPNHGRWEDNFSTMYLNRSVIDLDPEESMHLIIHEVGHGLDHKLGDISKTEDWLKLSGWTMQPPGISTLDKSDHDCLLYKHFRRLKIEEKGFYTVSDWWYDENAHFVRWYASRNPQEDFCESFAYYLILGEKERFKECEDKKDFIRDRVMTYERAKDIEPKKDI